MMSKLNQLTMILGFVAAGLLAFSAKGFANDQLAAQMKQMSADYKQIKAQVNNSVDNASTIQLLDDMAAAITRAETFVPDPLADLPADQQTAQLKGFQALLEQLKAKVAEMKADLVKGDNAAAAALLPALLAIKKQGHSTYDP